MSHWKEFIEQTFATIVFCIAIFMLWNYYNSFQSMLIAVDDNPSIVHEQLLILEEESVVTYAYLVAQLMEPLEFDIQINDCLFRKEEHRMDHIQMDQIPRGDYKKIYTYGEMGEILKIHYISILKE